MKTVDIAGAKAHFEELIDDVTRGETVIVTREGRNVACVVPCAERLVRREFGFDDGRMLIADDFDRMPAEFVRALTDD